MKDLDEAKKGKKTKLQWMSEGRLPNEDADGVMLYTNGYHQFKVVYYSFEETHEAKTEEMKIAKEPYLARRRELAKKRRAKAKAQKEAQERAAKEESRINEAREQRNRYVKESLKLPIVPCYNPSEIVVFDTETTGLDSYNGDILQFTACDGDGNVLLDMYFKPTLNDSWDEAERIHGISPDMVNNSPYIYELIPTIRGIFDSAKLLVTYNGVFDEDFLAEIGIDLRNIPEFDVMREFAPIYGEWNEYFGDYKWQKLVTCASYYGYEFKAHDSKEDTLATLFCYKKILESEKKGDVMKKYNCGYGQPKDNWSIENVALASFVNLHDAYEFIKMKHINGIAEKRIYYVDVDDKRMFYNERTNNFTPELKDIYIFGYEIIAELESDDCDTNDVFHEYDTGYSVTYKGALEVEKRFNEYGAVSVSISEEKLSIIHHFFINDEFKKSEQVNRNNDVDYEMER